MNRYLLDVNLALALIDPQHEHHAPATAWGNRRSDARWLTCPIVQNGVVRVAGLPAYSRRTGHQQTVYAALRIFCAQPRHEFCADDVSLLDASLVLRPELLTHKRVTDVYLLALATRHGARLATIDQGVAAEIVAGGANALELVPT